MNEMQRFIGDGVCHAKNTYPEAHDKPEPYIAAPSLVNAVNMALQLRRPLLLEGDPGCGKTRLAYAVAYELGYPLKECYIRSTNRARDLLYTYDALRRLYDVQMAVAKKDFIAQEDESAFAPSKYVTLGQLGEAIELSQNGIPSVVLIDEIDKAEYDFPNDLLQLLEQLCFSVDEVQALEYDALRGGTREERRNTLPLFVITSNHERELPRPFLRRCLYYYIDFPNLEALQSIIERHFQQGITPLFLAAVRRFWQLREADFSWRKPPSTSELLDWLHILETAERQGKLTTEQLEQLPLPELPFLETLIKTQSDRIAISNSDLLTENIDNGDVS